MDLASWILNLWESQGPDTDHQAVHSMYGMCMLFNVMHLVTLLLAGCIQKHMGRACKFFALSVCVLTFLDPVTLDPDRVLTHCGHINENNSLRAILTKAVSKNGPLMHGDHKVVHVLKPTRRYCDGMQVMKCGQGYGDGAPDGANAAPKKCVYLVNSGWAFKFRISGAKHRLDPIPWHYNASEAPVLKGKYGMTEVIKELGDRMWAVLTKANEVVAWVFGLKDWLLDLSSSAKVPDLTGGLESLSAVVWLAVVLLAAVAPIAALIVIKVAPEFFGQQCLCNPILAGLEYMISDAAYLTARSMPCPKHSQNNARSPCCQECGRYRYLSLDVMGRYVMYNCPNASSLSKLFPPCIAWMVITIYPPKLYYVLGGETGFIAEGKQPTMSDMAKRVNLTITMWASQMCLEHIGPTCLVLVLNWKDTKGSITYMFVCNWLLLAMRYIIRLVYKYMIM